jgi:1,4-dihydroxy-2-naphthoate octaprenyltransferase
MRALYHLGNWGPLIAWSGCAILLGIGSAIHEAGADAVDWALVAVASTGTAIIQYAAHPVNDLLDYEVDARANIKGTGRHKVLHSGLASRLDLVRLSSFLIIVAIAMMVYVTVMRPLALVFGLIGLFGLWSYNWKPLKLSYHPFSELVVDIPVNIAMVMAIAFVAVNQVLYLAFVVGIVQTFMALSMHTSYFAMDTESDAVGGKESTIVAYPKYPWCTIYPSLGFLAVAVFAALGTSIWVLLVPAVLFGVQIGYGLEMDSIRFTYLKKHRRLLHTGFFGRSLVRFPEKVTDDWQATSHQMRKILTRQTLVMIVDGIALAAILVLQ